MKYPKRMKEEDIEKYKRRSFELELVRVLALSKNITITGMLRKWAVKTVGIKKYCYADVEQLRDVHTQEEAIYAINWLKKKYMGR